MKTKKQSIIHKCLSEIYPSPENDKLYRPIQADDPEIQKLADSIIEHGLREPLVITLDGFILSGHRRYAAAKLAGLQSVPCRIESIRRLDDPDQFTKLLREYNRQRVKNFAEVVREAAVDTSPDTAYEALLEHRKNQNRDMSRFCQSAALAIGRFKGRCAITRAKYPLLNAAKRVADDNRDFWPLSVRQIHYRLLNDPPLIHAGKPTSRYQNTQRCYKRLVDILARARVAGLFPWDAIADETRPVTHWRVYANPAGFIDRQMKTILAYYRRDLMQSQPAHIEIVAEKLTVKSIVEEVAGRYSIPVTIGRGYASLNPRRDMALRFKESGRDKLVVLLISDFDPDGEEIAQSFARSLRDDFNIGGDELTPIKVAITADQVRQYRLPPSMEAKASSSNYKKFRGKHGRHAYELEALEPATLQQILQQAIDSVIDVEAFNAELAAEKADAGELAGLRGAVQKLMAEYQGGAA